jgi:hypothetical protein
MTDRGTGRPVRARIGLWRRTIAVDQPSRPQTSPANAVRQLPASLAAELLEQSLGCVPTIDMTDIGARLLAPLVAATNASRASLMLVNPDTGKLRIIAGAGLPRELIGRDIEWKPSSIAEWVFRKGQGTVLQGDVKKEGLVGTGEGEIESSICVPLQADDHVIGVLNLASKGSEPPFHEENLETLAAILPPVAAAVERALYANRCARNTEQIDATRGLNGRTLLAPGRYEGRNYEIGYSRLSCVREGSSACERVPFANGGLALLAVDPRAEGVDALLAVAFTPGVFVAIASAEKSAAAIVSRMNAELCARLGQRGEMGAWVGLLSPSGQLASCSAGYTPPLWLPGDGSDVTPLPGGGPSIGAEASNTWEEELVRLLPGDMLVTASSGVIGARNVMGQPFGHSRLEEIVNENRRQPLDSIADGVIGNVVAWSGRPTPIADLCVLAVRFTPGA